jgi:hypothetical protein
VVPRFPVPVVPGPWAMVECSAELGEDALALDALGLSWATPSNLATEASTITAATARPGPMTWASSPGRR